MQCITSLLPLLLLLLSLGPALPFSSAPPLFPARALAAPRPWALAAPCTPPPPPPFSHAPTRLHAGSGRLSGGEATKRQSRVSQLLRSTLASIIFDGYCIRSSPSTSPLPANTRLAINVIAADVSPDLRNARVSVSVISSPTVDAAAKREAFAWLAANAGPIRHACAQRLSHMKTVPELTFKMTDVGAAVDVMNLIDRIAAGDDIRDDVVYDRSLLGDEAEWDNYEDEDDDEFGEEEEEEGEEGDLSEEDERRLKDLLKF